MLTALLERAGAVVTDAQTIADEHRELDDAVRAGPVDVVVVTRVLLRGQSRSPASGAAGDGRTAPCRRSRVPARTSAGAGRNARRRLGHRPAGQPLRRPGGLPDLLEPLLYGLLARARRPTLALAVHGEVRPLRNGTRLVPVRLDGDRAIVVAGARSPSLRAAAVADGVAVVEPTWAFGGVTEVLRLP
jgi:molybdopterin molybdotransferase